MSALLWAVHISDGVLLAPWLLAGWGGAFALVWMGTRRLGDEEIPQIALLTAVFFIASTLHVPMGLTSVHLLFNGLVGVLLGWRSGLAILLGLALQAILLGHGGFSTLGINACVMGLPALCAGLAFRSIHRLPLQHRRFRSSLVMASSLLWLVALLFGAALLLHNFATRSDEVDWTIAGHFVLQPIMLVLAVVWLVGVGWVESRWETSPEFSIGLLLGLLTVLATISLNCLVLLFGGETFWSAPPLILFLAHLPIAVVEGLILGITLSFLAKVKPELLG